MEPPAKRLRLSESVAVAVDETDPAYIAAKEKQRAQLKNRFDSIFSKFEAIPEAMTDEIDMRTGEIVIDRGHTRKLDREYKKRLRRRTGQLLDDLFPDELDQLSDGEEGVEETTRDELAPSQSPEPRVRKQHGNHSACAQSPMRPAQEEPLPKSHLQQAITAPPYTPSDLSIQPTAHLSGPAAASPASNWMHLVQFPQTPAGNLAQTAFMAQITQAVQQAITPLISNMLASTPEVLAQNASTSTQTHPRPLPYHATPATEPSLRLQAPPRTADTITAPQSSPVPTRKARLIPAKAVTLRTTDPQESRRTVDEKDATKVNDRSSDTQDTTPRIRNHSRKYRFNEADERHLIGQKTKLNRSWAEIQSSRSSYALQNHYNLRLNQSTFTVTKAEPSRLSSRERKKDLIFPSANILGSSPTPTSHHLPTPNSLGHDETGDVVEDLQGVHSEEVDELITSGNHFDQEEQELLSLVGADDLAEQCPEDTSVQDVPAALNDVLKELEPADNVLLSIELDANSRSPSPVQYASTKPNISGTVSKPNVPPVSNITSTTLSSPSKRKAKKRPISFRVDSDSGDDLDLIGADSPSIEPNQSPFMTPKSRRRLRRDNPKRRAPSLTGSSPPPDLTDEDDDELLAPSTPLIKRESYTPPLTTRFLATSTSTALHTPRSAPQLATLPSSGAASASKLARSAFQNKVKRSWAKVGRRSTPGPKTIAKRSSFGFAPKQRAWADERLSGDELAA